MQLHESNLMFATTHNAFHIAYAIACPMHFYLIFSEFNSTSGLTSHNMTNNKQQSQRVKARGKGQRQFHAW